MAGLCFEMCIVNQARHMFRIFVLLILLLMVKPCCANDVRYLSFEGYPNRHYFEEIIRAAMQETAADFGDFRLIPYKQNIPAERIVYETIEGKKTNLAWGPAVHQLTEVDVITIENPLLNGLAGIRVLLVTPESKDKFKNIKTIKELARKKIGQHQAWIDADIIRSNGIPVMRAERFSALMSMLVQGRFDGVPLGSNHVLDSLTELHSHPQTKNIILEENLLIYYPLPFFFFVNKSEQSLANRLQLGLIRIKSNGEFDRIFNKHFGTLVNRLNIHSRHPIVLNNPYLQTQFDSPLISPQPVVDSNL